MPFLGVQPTDTFASVAKQTITGDGSVTYTLTHSVAGANDLAVFVNNVRQEPTVAYSASGTSITFTEAIDSTDDCYVVYIARTFQTVTPPDNSINADQLSYPLTNFSSTGIDDNAASTAVTIDSSENVGIGEASPDNRLHIKQSADNSAAGLGLKIEKNADDSALFVGYRDNTDTWQINASYTSTGSFEPISFHTSDAERMRIDASGNLGIGRSSPQARLDVEGGNQIFRATSSGYTTFWSHYNTDPFDGATYDRLEIRFDTTNPIVYLNSSAYSTAASRRIAFQHAGYTKFSIDSDGVKFNGDTAAANALDDYEESGSWSFNTVTPSGLIATNNHTTYTKVGRLCHISLFVQVAVNSNTNGLYFTLPFTANGSYSSLAMSYKSGGTGTPRGPLVSQNSNLLTIRDTSGAVMSYSQFSGTYVIISGTYETT